MSNYEWQSISHLWVPWCSSHPAWTHSDNTSEHLGRASAAAAHSQAQPGRPGYRCQALLPSPASGMSAPGPGCCDHTASSQPSPRITHSPCDGKAHKINASTQLSLLHGWLRGTVVERQSLAGKLSLSCTRPAADEWPLMWVNHPL